MAPMQQEDQTDAFCAAQVPFMNLLPRLPEDILAKTKEPLISQAGLTYTPS